MNIKYFLSLLAVALLLWAIKAWVTQPAQKPPAPFEVNAKTISRENMLSANDLDADGFPDACELDAEQDRQNFRRWFVSIAVSQLYQEDPAWRADDHDCAGFIRFAYREALKRHDNDWLRQKPFLIDAAIPDVRKYSYPDVPLLQTRIFRTGAGHFTTADLSDTTFAVTAVAAKLRTYNTVFLGKSLETVQPGDLLFYLNAGDAKMPQHSMIFLGDGRRPASFTDEVIYHTGPRDDTPGALKKVRLVDLLQHPDERWHPTPENRYFLGYYRWKILN